MSEPTSEVIERAPERKVAARSPVSVLTPVKPPEERKVSPPPQVPRSSTAWDDDEDEERSFFQKYRILLIVGVLVAIGGIAFALMPSGPKHTSVEPSMVRITLPPPLPPPPPPPQPPQQQPPPEQKVVDQKMIEQPEVKPDEKPPEAKAPDQPPGPVGTNIAGNGNDGFGLGRSGGGGFGSGTGRGAGGSRWGWYAGQVQTRMADALRSNHKTRNATISGVQVQIWADSTGRVTRTRIKGSTGDAGLDQALKGEVFTGLQLSEPPPQDMPMPINLRLNARRPN